MNFPKKFDWLNHYLCVLRKTKCSGLEDIMMTDVFCGTLNFRDLSSCIQLYVIRINSKNEAISILIESEDSVRIQDVG